MVLRYFYARQNVWEFEIFYNVIHLNLQQRLNNAHFDQEVSKGD